MRHAFALEDTVQEVWLSRRAGSYRLLLDEREYPVALEVRPGGNATLSFAGETHEILLAADGDNVHLHVEGTTLCLRYVDPVTRFASHHGPTAEDLVVAPMPGTVVQVAVKAGQPVARGDLLVVIESMKLETAIRATRAGVVEAVHVSIGQMFERSARLVTLAPEA